MSKTKQFHVPSLDGSHPELLIALLEYALEDVRRISARSADHLEAAIELLSQECGPHAQDMVEAAGRRLS